MINDLEMENPKDQKFLRVCFVCTEAAKPDKEHLKNYGGIVCFSCRAFWRRSHQKTRSPIFQCKRNGNCVITVSNRRQCQFCRYQRCLMAGMRPEAVLDEKQKRFHFRKLLQRQEKKLAMLRKIGSQGNSVMREVRLPIRKPVILENYDIIGHKHISITYSRSKSSYHRSFSHSIDELLDNNDSFTGCSLSDLQEIPTENLFFSSVNQKTEIDTEEHQTLPFTWTKL